MVIIPAVLLIDQLSKFIVKTSMTLGQSTPVLGDWFIIHFTENYGMAFGLEFSGEYGKLVLSIFRIVAVIFIGWYIARLIRQQAHSGLVACVSLIMAGALGNIIDSSVYGLIFSESSFNTVAVFMPEGGGYGTFLHGKVVDMLYFPIIQGFFPEWVPWLGGQHFIFFRPVFNFADTSITTGVFLLIIFQKKLFPKPQIQKTTESLQSQGDPMEDSQGKGDPQAGEDSQSKDDTMEDPQGKDDHQSIETSQMPEKTQSHDIPHIQDYPDAKGKSEAPDNTDALDNPNFEVNYRVQDNFDAEGNSEAPNNSETLDNPQASDNTKTRD